MGGDSSNHPNNNGKQPKLANRREHRHSKYMSGRTIGAQREKIETANEREAARKKDKKKKAYRIAFTAAGFLLAGGVLIVLFINFATYSASTEEEILEKDAATEIEYAPSIEIIDEDSSTKNQITKRMSAYIGRAEKDFKDLGYTPVKAVLPTGAVREVDFYLQEKPGFIKMIIDRETSISTEDADRMFKYLDGKGITEYSYIDVRIDGRAYWK